VSLPRFKPGAFPVQIIVLPPKACLSVWQCYALWSKDFFEDIIKRDPPTTFGRDN
jgi:hypothetical protein